MPPNTKKWSYMIYPGPVYIRVTNSTRQHFKYKNKIKYYMTIPRISTSRYLTPELSLSNILTLIFDHTKDFSVDITEQNSVRVLENKVF